jgi:hypothetical protein
MSLLMHLQMAVHKEAFIALYLSLLCLDHNSALESFELQVLTGLDVRLEVSYFPSVTQIAPLKWAEEISFL